MTIGERSFVHGEARDGYVTAEYKAWTSMIQRCLTPTNCNYPRYGGRGITVCDRWRTSFTDFLSDVGRKPSPEYSLNRLRNEGNYGPGNVEWANAETQARNRRNNTFVEFQGERLCISEWASRVGLGKGTLKFRLDHDWTIEQALTTPARPKAPASPLRVVPGKGEAA